VDGPTCNDAPPAAATPQVVVVSPTYNEVDNVERLADAVLGTSPGYHLLVVDDSSPDGTSELTASLSAAEPRIELLQRHRRRGYGPAVASGLVAALSAGAPRIVMMDADGSHEARYIPDLVDALDRGADIAIGSRYVSKGGIRRWPLSRRMLSRGANMYIGAVLDLPVRDNTSGFRGFRARTLQRCDPRLVRARGYAFHIELLSLILGAGLTAEEVPIQFTNRTRGRSNLSLEIIVESVINPWRIRRMDARQ